MPLLFHELSRTSLWERRTKGEEPIETCTILTSDARRTLRHLHDRMPVVLNPAGFSHWLDPTNRGAAEVEDLLRTAPNKDRESQPVGTVVNSPRHDNPSLLDPSKLKKQQERFE